MSDTVAIAILAALPPTLAGIAAVLLAWRTRAELKRVATKVDGRIDQLVRASNKASRLAGVRQEQVAQTRREKEPPKRPPTR